MPLFSELVVRKLRLSVRLGCGADERSNPQPVDIDIGVRFGAPPRGCGTDEINDTVCYDELAKRLRQYVAGREFKLVERLARELYDEVRPLMPSGTALALRVVKLRPPVAELNGGVSFSYGEWNAPW